MSMKTYELDLIAKDGVTKLDKQETISEQKLMKAIESRLRLCVPGETVVIRQVK